MCRRGIKPLPPDPGVVPGYGQPKRTSSPDAIGKSSVEAISTLSSVSTTSVLASRHDANYVALPHVHIDPLRAAHAGLPVELTELAGHFLISEVPDLVAAHLARHPALAA